MPRTFADVAPERATPDRHTRPFALKRALDVTIASLLVVVTLPLLLAATLMLACEASGPILVSHPRVGRDGRIFGLLRFRSRKPRHPTDDGAPVGRFLVATRIVTLPQLFNVLLGDMSMVGPQPLHPDVAARRARVIAGYDRRHLTRPGLTGRAQLCRPDVSSLSDVRAELSDDLDYLARPSAAGDLRIIVGALRGGLAYPEPR